jgi:V-type H+-transporting ATPase subunit a
LLPLTSGATDCCFAYINARHFKRPVDIWGNFVPGMIFFRAIFGHLVVCIIYKWTVDIWGNFVPGMIFVQAIFGHHLGI